MFEVNDKKILTPPIDVLIELRKQLKEKQDVDLFADLKQSGSNIQITCPKHANGKERRPSCGVACEDTEKIKSGVVHCFTCGYSTTIDQMISDVFGYNDLGSYGRRWLIQTFLHSSIGERRDIKLSLVRNEKKEDVEYVKEQELTSYRYYHPYMYTRKLNNEIIERFDVGYDYKNNCLTFPVRDKTGGALFIARRSINGKFFNNPQHSEKPVYGLYELLGDEDEIVICESIINALTCYVYGKPAIALMGTGKKDQYETIKKIKCRKFIFGFDGDVAGDAALERGCKALKNYKILSYYDMPDNKDINDLSEKEFYDLSVFPIVF